MNEFNIRKAEVCDKDIIYNNLKLCSNKMYEEQGLDHWIPVYAVKNIEKDIKEKIVFVIEYNNNIIGNFTLNNSLNDLWKQNEYYNKIDKCIYVSKLCIIPEYSRHGLGKKCMEFIEKYAKDNSYKYVCLDVYDKAIHAVKFYKKIEYKVVGEAKTRRFNVLLMKKDINDE